MPEINRIQLEMSPSFSSPTQATSEAEILGRTIPWETFTTAQLLSPQDLQLIRRFDKKVVEEQLVILSEEGSAYAHTFLTVLRNITKDDVVQYTLALIKQILVVDESKAALFHADGLDPYTPLLKLLQRDDRFTQETACQVLVCLLASRPGKGIDLAVDNGAQRVDATETSSSSSNEILQLGPAGDVVVSLVEWLCQQLRQANFNSERSPRTLVATAAKLLVERPTRLIFLRSGGAQLLVPLLKLSSSPANVQLLYEATFCVWMLTFIKPAAEALCGAGLLPALVEIARNVGKEKVIRMVVLSLKNLLEIEGCPFGSEMADLNVLKVLGILQQGTWTDDELITALETLDESLRTTVKEASTFDKYRKEVLSGTLDWSPMHTESSFWRENITKFEQQNYQILKVVLKLMEVSREPRTLAVACHDLGQFMQHHSSGKHIVQDLKGKELAMGLMAHPDPEVQKQALLCVQKLMINNWQMFQTA
mmetsp:Transcript_26756/g.58258  ORF Transcript_26756/g.58258 Transcript_26756/m.58258 type:complete len:480 (-) Transcript_26756:1191-2630(-)|eukprot:CAMPEP_0118935300 /NCGR_PEP_ID=MMETSP1169-20130426/15365_1 /TAXON_ID=36882 /ORGANISM="Pyramimonas obovata, Strain CCMP722" /LENGTH=479 /DNA_ID=CAMNT_0006878315 /DNA_START=53 /DNA_END=1492 /DNA_ORIENTATION=-